MFTIPSGNPLSAPPKANDVSLTISGKEFKFWADLEIKLSLDRFSEATFTAPFEPERKEFRETFRPFTYQPIEIKIGGKPLFTGTMLLTLPRVTPERRMLEVKCYAKPAVLCDCDAPADMLPLEFKDVRLITIADKLLEPFGLNSIWEASYGSPFAKVAIKADQNIFGFIAGLARQRNIVVSNTPTGEVLFWQSLTTGTPIGSFSDSEQPVSVIDPQFEPQKYYSEITGFGVAKRRKSGAKHTEKNPWLTGVSRPKTFKLEDTERADAQYATKAKMGRMFGNMVAYKISNIPTWRDPSGELFAPNTLLNLTAPNSMVYKETQLCIRTVTLSQTANTRTTSLEVVLPGAFSGEVPTRLPWDE